MTDTFKLNKDFRRLYGRGKSSVSPALVSYVLPYSGKRDIIGITVGKKLGGAVERNRAKRLIRAAWREISPSLDTHVEAVFVARTRILTLKSTDVANTMRQHMMSAGVMSGEKR